MKTFRLKSIFDNLELAVAVTEPESKPYKGIFQISHGMAEHKERYYPFMEYLSSNGYVCVIHDHRGHGESVRCKDDLGYMYSGGAVALVEDLKLVQDRAKADYPGLGCTLFGHSMGSMVVRAFTRKYDDCIDALIVCGCPSDNPLKTLALAFAGIISFFKGDHHRPSSLDNLAFGSYNREFTPEEGRHAWLSANRDNVAEYEKDELCGFTFTANGFRNLFRIMKACYAPKGWKMSSPDMPILFVSGADDPCRISDHDFEKAVGFMRKRGYANVSSRLFPGLRHELLLEDAPEVWPAILEFLEQKG